jgi:hypothetical protein
MLNGNRYLLFLNPGGKGSEEEFFVVGNQCGVFELKADDTVVPYAQSSDQNSKYKGNKHSDFISQVEDLVNHDEAEDKDKSR